MKIELGTSRQQHKLGPVTSIGGAVLVLIAFAGFAIETFVLKGDRIFREYYISENPVVVAFEVTQPHTRYAAQVDPDRDTRLKGTITGPSDNTVFERSEKLGNERIRTWHFTPEQQGTYTLTVSHHSVGFSPDVTVAIYANDRRMTDRIRLPSFIRNLFTHKPDQP